MDANLIVPFTGLFDTTTFDTTFAPCVENHWLIVALQTFVASSLHTGLKTRLKNCDRASTSCHMRSVPVGCSSSCDPRVYKDTCSHEFNLIFNSTQLPTDFPVSFFP